jgi:hypothetical protein
MTIKLVRNARLYSIEWMDNRSVILYEIFTREWSLYNESTIPAFARKETEENYESPFSVEPMSRPRFEPSASWTREKSVTGMAIPSVQWLILLLENFDRSHYQAEQR